MRGRRDAGEARCGGGGARGSAHVRQAISGLDAAVADPQHRIRMLERPGDVHRRAAREHDDERRGGGAQRVEERALLAGELEGAAHAGLVLLRLREK